MTRKVLFFIVGYFLYVPGVFLALALGVTFADRYVETSENPVPGWLMLILLAVIIGGPAVWFALTWNRPNRWQRQLQKHGSQALARIVDVADTGISSGAGLTIYVRLTLEVHPSGEAPFTTKLEIANSRVSIMRPGGVIPIRYDPTNHAHVVYDETPGAGQVGSGWEADAPAAATWPGGENPGPGVESLLVLLGKAGANPHEYVRDETERVEPGNDDADQADQPEGDIVDRLAKLDELHRSGALTDAEYTAAKARLLT